MSTIQDLLPVHHALKEHLVIDVCFKVGKRHRKETIPFPNDIKELLDNYLPYEFDTPSGFHLYGLVRNPINGTVHAFIDSDEEIECSKYTNNVQNKSLKRRLWMMALSGEPLGH